MVKCLFFQDATLKGQHPVGSFCPNAPAAGSVIQWCCHKHSPEASGDPPRLTCQGETVHCTIPTGSILDYRAGL